MKFTTAKEHRDFFLKNGWIEFEGLLSLKQTSEVNQAIDAVLAKRLPITKRKIQESCEMMFAEGFDLWRADSLLQKIATQMRFCELAASLIEKKILRLAYDQLLPFYQENQILEKKQTNGNYFNFTSHTRSLEEISCVNRLACALMLSLNDLDLNLTTQDEPVAGIDVFPRKAGNVIFFRPNIPIHWNYLHERQGERFLLIVYAEQTAYYQLQEQDPHTHAFKRLGYVFNDKLSDKLHPIVFRN